VGGNLIMELNIQVDKNDKVIGYRPKEEFHNSELIHRSSHLFLFNSKGELLVQKRSKKKKIYPGLLDISVSGSVLKGETYEQTMEREQKEELNISVPFKKLFKFSHFDKYDKAFKMAFTAKYNGEFKLKKDEVEKVFWMDLEELKKMIEKTPQKLCGPFLTGIKIYFQKFGFKNK
jgi:isopentenyl-diphosphate delta-isomerase type 1